MDFSTAGADGVSSSAGLWVSATADAADAAEHQAGCSSLVMLTGLGPLAAALAGLCALDLLSRLLGPLLAGVPAVVVPASLGTAPLPLPLLPCVCENAHEL